MLPLDLSDRVALVTGVSRGIGAEIARTLTAAGCDMAGCATSSPDSDGAQRFVADVGERGRETLCVQADMTEEDAIARLVGRTGERFGGIDVLVSNAGRNVFRGAGVQPGGVGGLHGPGPEGALAREPLCAPLDGRRRRSGHHHFLQPRPAHDPRPASPPTWRRPG